MLLKYDKEKNIAIYRVEGEQEIGSYRMLLNEDSPICPSCGKDINVKDANLLVFVNNPGNQGLFGFTVGEPRVKCEECGAVFSLHSMPDVAAWPSIQNHINKVLAARAKVERVSMPIREDFIE